MAIVVIAAAVVVATVAVVAAVVLRSACQDLVLKIDGSIILETQNVPQRHISKRMPNTVLFKICFWLQERHVHTAEIIITITVRSCMVWGL